MPPEYCPVTKWRRRAARLPNAARRLWVALPLLPVLALLYGSVQPVHAASVPGGFTDTTVASGLAKPTAMAFAPDGRLFVCQQEGKLRVIKNGALLPTPFVSLNVNSAGERGLLGIAFDPDFPTNQHVYVYYTVPTSPIHNRVSRFTANGDVALAGSETVLLELNNLSGATNHNGGSLHFGPDGKLYIGVGENANSSNSQTLANLLGKLLRINADGSIPTDNPFYQTATGNNRAIWALGLRNPYTFAFQPDTGRLLINDVGQNTWEEINEGIAGANYGWPVHEGFSNDPRYQNPIFVYGHDIGCAITGGSFYNPATSQFPNKYVSGYFFADYCGGWIHWLTPPAQDTVQEFATGISSPVDLKVGPEGSLYYLARGTGSTTGLVSKITYSRGTVSLSGTVTLDGCVNPVQPVTFRFRPKDGGLEFDRTSTLNSDGTFLLAGLPAGNYNVGVKGSKWLQKAAPANLDNGSLTGLAVTLPAGDITDDNFCDIDDLGALAYAYGTEPGDPRWNPQADLNCDGYVDIDDVGLFALSFGRAGDP